jgi:ParB/RepB/Spo0J family partition protein
MEKDPQVIEIPLEKLTISKFNVRRELGDISELVESIKAVGVLQPILVRPIGGDKYEVVVGSRRFAAAQKAKLKTIPAIVKEMSDDEAIVESLTENIQRGDLEIEEIAEAYKIAQKWYTKEAFASKIGKTQEWLSQIWIAYNSVIKLRQAGKPYRIKARPTAEERERGTLPYKVLTEVEYALKSEEVCKVFPAEKIDDVRVMLVEAIKDLDYDDAKRVIDYFKMYPEKPIEEVRDMALARKTGVELKTFVPASVMRKVEETAEKIGKPVEVIVPSILEKGVEEEVRRVEVEKLLERAPPYVVEVARKMESTMTPQVISKILELPEEKREDAVKYIETLRLSEEEALNYIETLKIEAPPIPEAEIEAIRKRYEEVQRRIAEIASLPEVRKRGELFRNWHSHYIIFQGLQEAFCPNCGRERGGVLVWSCCGLPAKDALKVAGDKFEKSQKEN